MSNKEGAGFIIEGRDMRLLATCDSHLFRPYVLEAKLHATCAGIVYARFTLCVDHLVIKGDSYTIIGWI